MAVRKRGRRRPA